MSLILDALKKSEAERQRHTGPTLLDVRIARPQRRYPIWAFIVGGLLLVFVLRRPPAEPVAANPPAQSAVTAQPAAVQSAPAPAPGIPTALVAPPQTNVPAAAPAPVQVPVQIPAQVPATATAAAPTLTDDESDDASANPADVTPAVAPTQRPAGGSVKYQRDDSGGYASLPSYSELGNLPPLRLDLHVYAERPHDRYAMINMQAVHEGDTLTEGVRILAITHDGVAMDFKGQQFILRPQ